MRAETGWEDGPGARTPTLRALPLPLRFSDLFSLAEEYEDSSTKPPKSRRKAALSSPRSRKNATQPPNAEEESGSSSASVRPLAGHATHGMQGEAGCGRSWAWQLPGLATLPPLSPRRKKTQNRSPPRGNGKGPLQWGLTVTEALFPVHPQLDCPPLLGESEVNRGWGDRRGSSLSPSQSSPREKDELPPGAQPSREAAVQPPAPPPPLWGPQPPRCCSH